MALLNDILAWSQNNLKPWQQDAVRRLFQQTVDNSALEDLYAMLKSSFGLPDPLNRKPLPLSIDHLPTVAPKGQAAILMTLKDVKNVNRLALNQSIEFAKRGLTVVYGGNGSGKSGYARILKHACRARDTSEEIRPNALNKPDPTIKPQAAFDVLVNGNTSTVIWEKGKASPTELATIAVFDSHCARAYLDQNQEVAYLPFGLDVVENLAQVVFPKLSAKLKTEIESISVSKDAFNNLIGTTKIGALVANLSGKTKETDITNLAQLSNDEIERIGILKKVLGESDPEAKAKELRLAAGRLTNLKTKIETITAWVKDEAIQKLQNLDTEAEEAIKAEANAAELLRSGESLLPGTGDIKWKLLFEAAEKFSKELAFPQKNFPHVHDGAKCLLCQQELTTTAGDRLIRFYTYIQADVGKTALEKRNGRLAAIKKIVDVQLTVDIDETLLEELAELDKSVIDEIRAFQASVESRRTWMLKAQESHNWNNVPQFSTNPCILLEGRVKLLQEQEENFKKANDENKKRQLKSELDELVARELLIPQKQALIDLVKRMEVRDRLNKCATDLKTNSITSKAKEFANAAVTEPLRIALQSEFQALGIFATIPSLCETVEKGKMRHKLELKLEATAPIKDILSEGEQRAIAIGSFLAELSTSGHDGGIIFDDPVSSLDHFRRKHVAERLTREAKNRQVIIFTHDTTFLGELRDQ